MKLNWTWSQQQRKKKTTKFFFSKFDLRKKILFNFGKQIKLEPLGVPGKLGEGGGGFITALGRNFSKFFCLTKRKGA